MNLEINAEQLIVEELMFACESCEPRTGDYITVCVRVEKCCYQAAVKDEHITEYACMC